MELQGGAEIAAHVRFLGTIYVYTGSKGVNKSTLDPNDLGFNKWWNS